MKTIGICMIVKNEANIIQRCLDSVRPLVDYVLVEDTGSTDGTQAVIRDYLEQHGLRGEVFDIPWRDFAHNRSIALARLREKTDIDYALVIDADDVLVIEEGFDPVAFKQNMTGDIYDAILETGPIKYRRAMICSNRLPFSYRGVLHEYMVRPEEAGPAALLTGMTVLSTREGARGQDPDKYRKDAAVFEDALVTETDERVRARYIFYLAQSYRDGGEPERALTNYLKRAALGGWPEEVFISLFCAGALMEQLDYPDVEIIGTYLKAFEARPGRAESLHGATTYCRKTDRFHQGYLIGKHALTIPQPAEALFLVSSVYEYGLLDDFSINAYWAGYYQEALDASDRLLEEAKFPAAMRERIESNRKFAWAKVEEQAAASAALAPPAVVGFLDPVGGGSGPVRDWAPASAQGGTELMRSALNEHCAGPLSEIDLRVNLFDPAQLTGKPLVLWMHHDADQEAVQWCRNPELTSRVHTFVFVSHWQQERYLSTFGLPPQHCVVLRNATRVGADIRSWSLRSEPWQLAYASTPFRGLAVLLDAWRQLNPPYAVLNIWSSMKLYGPPFDDSPYQGMIEQAMALPNVVYHGIEPNARLRESLRNIDFLAYPSIFAETACLSVIEAMAAGCRVVCPALGALPETSAGFARLYPWNPDPARHAADFAAVLADELANPWQGQRERAAAQHTYCQGLYDWSVRSEEWRRLIAAIRATHPVGEA